MVFSRQVIVRFSTSLRCLRLCCCSTDSSRQALMYCASLKVSSVNRFSSSACLALMLSMRRCLLSIASLSSAISSENLNSESLRQALSYLTAAFRSYLAASSWDLSCSQSPRSRSLSLSATFDSRKRSSYFFLQAAMSLARDSFSELEHAVLYRSTMSKWRWSSSSLASSQHFVMLSIWVNRPATFCLCCRSFSTYILSISMSNVRSSEVWRKSPSKQSTDSGGASVLRDSSSFWEFIFQFRWNIYIAYAGVPSLLYSIGDPIMLSFDAEHRLWLLDVRAWLVVWPGNSVDVLVLLWLGDSQKPVLNGPLGGVDSPHRYFVLRVHPSRFCDQPSSSHTSRCPSAVSSNCSGFVHQDADLSLVALNGGPFGGVAQIQRAEGVNTVHSQSGAEAFLIVETVDNKEGLLDSGIEVLEEKAAPLFSRVLGVALGARSSDFDVGELHDVDIRILEVVPLGHWVLDVEEDSRISDDSDFPLDGILKMVSPKQSTDGSVVASSQYDVGGVEIDSILGVQPVEPLLGDVLSTEVEISALVGDRLGLVTLVHGAIAVHEDDTGPVVEVGVVGSASREDTSERPVERIGQILRTALVGLQILVTALERGLQIGLPTGDSSFEEQQEFCFVYSASFGNEMRGRSTVDADTWRSTRQQEFVEGRVCRGGAQEYCQQQGDERTMNHQLILQSICGRAMEAGIASTDCSVCFQPYNSKDKLPLSLSCGHTFCSQCLSDLAKKEPSCPKCRARIDMTTARKVFDLIPNQQEKKPSNNNVLEEPPRMSASESGILCMNGEPAKWTGRRAECMKCNIVREGWNCKAHMFHLCDVCAKTCFSSSVCPNAHNPKWSGDWRNPNTCEKCNKRKVSLPCKTCKVRHCWNCKVNDRKARRCKKHNVEVTYREDKYCGVQGCLNQQSQICGVCRARCSEHNGDFEKVTLPCMTIEEFERSRQCSKWQCNNIACWSCRYCELRLCDICATTVMKKQSCPNDHKTTWTGQKQRCACCNATKSGFKCIACDYNLCESCSEKSPIIYEREPKEETCSMM